MEQLKNKVVDLVKENKKACLVGGALVALASLKRFYFRGGVCKADRNLDKKVIVITGGNSGIGKATVQVLAQKGCIVIIGARDKVKADALLQKIRSKNPDSQVLFFPLDLADKQSIKAFSQNVREVADCVNVLINNAGLILPDRRETKDGFEMMMGVNHLGHFYLTHLLWDLIKVADKPRVINVSSIAHYGARNQGLMDFIDFEDMNLLELYTTRIAYARSKMANVLFTRQLQQKINQAGIDVSTYSLHPGLIATEIGREFGLLYTVFKVVFLSINLFTAKTEWEGAQTTLHLVLEDESKLKKGQFYKDCQVCQSSAFTSNMDNAAKLWQVSQQMLGIKFDV